MKKLQRNSVTNTSFTTNPYDPLEKNPELQFSLEEVVQKYYNDHHNKGEFGVGDITKYNDIHREDIIGFDKNLPVSADDSKLMKSIVYHYLRTTGHGNFAEEFRTEFSLDKDDDWNNPPPKISMEDAVKKYLDDHDHDTTRDGWNLINFKKSSKSSTLSPQATSYLKEGRNRKKSIQKLKKVKEHKFRNPRNHFSAEEDELILEALKRVPSGGKLSSSALKELRITLNRDRKSIVVRIWKLENGSPENRVRTFSLEEDKIIVDEAIKCLKQCKHLELVELDRNVILRLKEDFKRTDQSIMERWYARMKVWLLQYYNKTLNLEIKPILANAIADNFESRDEIDWEFLTTFPEFIGHSAKSLKIPYNNVMSSFKNWFPDRVDATTRELATFASSSWKPRGPSKTTKIRQMEVIEYFEEQVKRHNIEHFMKSKI